MVVKIEKKETRASEVIWFQEVLSIASALRVNIPIKCTDF